MRIAELRIQADSLSQQLAPSAWILLAIVLGLWSLSTLVRKVGWRADDDLRPVVGIALPMLAGLASLILVMNAAG
jgi:hypothetical protein